MAALQNKIDSAIRDALLHKLSSRPIETHESDNKVLNQSVFEEIPVTFKEFFESKQHMAFPPLSQRQLDVAQFMLGTDPFQVFNNDNNVAVLIFGKGSGKDSLACLIILYIVYYCLCLRDPQTFFKFPSGESIDMLNVAMSADQASEVFFTKFKQRILRWAWLKRKYKIRASGTYVRKNKNEIDDQGNTVTILRNAIIFPKLIRAFSGHSAESSLEGKNLLCFVLDEAAAFSVETETQNADKIFSMLSSSALSRFGNKFKAFILSYPRHENDFIERMYTIAQSNLHWYSDRAATWEAKPERFFSGEWVDFDGHRIPKEYESEFLRDPVDAKCKYLCIPPKTQSPFLERTELIDACVDAKRNPIAQFEDYEEDGFTKKRFLGVPRADNKEYVVTMDLGVKGDAAAFSIFHADKSSDGRDIFVQDAVTSWRPDPGRKILVSFINIEETIINLKRYVPIQGVYFDQWQSVQLVQKLNQSGIPAFQYNLQFNDYKHMKEVLNVGSLRLLPHAGQLQELKQLRLLKNDKVDHPPTGSKDLADCVVGAIKVLGHRFLANKKHDNFGMTGTYISGNLGTAGGSFL